MTTYLIEGKDDETGAIAYGLQRNGSILTCPFRFPQMIAQPVVKEINKPKTGPQYQPIPCGDWCPHFELHKGSSLSHKNKYYVSLTCGNGRKIDVETLTPAHPGEAHTNMNVVK